MFLVAFYGEVNFLEKRPPHHMADVAYKDE